MLQKERGRLQEAHDAYERAVRLLGSRPVSLLAGAAPRPCAGSRMFWGLRLRLLGGSTWAWPQRGAILVTCRSGGRRGVLWLGRT